MLLSLYITLGNNTQTREPGRRPLGTGTNVSKSQVSTLQRGNHQVNIVSLKLPPMGTREGSGAFKASVVAVVRYGRPHCSTVNDALSSQGCARVGIWKCVLAAHSIRSNQGLQGALDLSRSHKSTGHGCLHVLSSARGTKTAHMVLATSDPVTGWGPPLPSPSSGFARVVLLSERLCPHGPKNPQPLCTFPTGEGRTFSHDVGSQTHLSLPPPLARTWHRDWG